MSEKLTPLTPRELDEIVSHGGKPGDLLRLVEALRQAWGQRPAPWGYELLEELWRKYGERMPMGEDEVDLTLLLDWVEMACDRAADGDGWVKVSLKGRYKGTPEEAAGVIVMLGLWRMQMDSLRGADS